MFLENVILKKKDIKTNQDFKHLKNYYKQLFLKKKIIEQKNLKNNYKKILKYIITIKYYRKNISLTASKIDGTTFFFCLSKPNKTEKKRKINPKFILKDLIKNLISNSPFILNEPVSLHLININSNKKTIVKEFSNLFLLVIKVFTINPHNGCRPSKKRRIKRKKKFFIPPKLTNKKLFLNNLKELNFIKV